MLIGEAARLSGTTVKAIRYYESIGLLPNVSRNGKYRIFNHSDVAIIQLIKKAQEIGLRLSDLKGATRLKEERADNKSIWLNIIAILEQQNERLDSQIDQLQIQKKLLSDYKEQISTCLSESCDCSFPGL